MFASSLDILFLLHKNTHYDSMSNAFNKILTGAQFSRRNICLLKLQATMTTLIMLTRRSLAELLLKTYYLSSTFPLYREFFIFISIHSPCMLCKFRLGRAKRRQTLFPDYSIKLKLVNAECNLGISLTNFVIVSMG